MRINYLFMMLLFLSIISCKNNGTQNSENSASLAGFTEGQSQTQNQQSKSKSNGYWEKLEMKEIGDGKGGVAAIIPMPSSWKFVSGGITGPNGIKITDYPGRSFMVNYNQSLQNTYAQGGQQMRSLPDIETLIQQDFVPVAAKNGLTYIKSYELPEVSKMDKWYSDQLFKAFPSTSSVKAYGTEWKYKNGNPYFHIIHVNASTSQSMQNWYYMSSGLDAEPAYFEKAKKQYIFSLANTRYNIEPIMAYNKEEAQRVGANWAAFNKRMATNQAAFEAQQIAHVNKSNAINDAIMSNWKSKNASSDKNQEQFIDAMYERTNVQSSETGKTYKVDEGANQYWMNNNGEYIGTQLQGYDPNLDDNMNEQKWDELKRIKK